MVAYVTMPLRISADMAERIDAHWHAQRLMSRAAAIRDLLERGLMTSGRSALSRPGPRFGGDGGIADGPGDPEGDPQQ
jgi:hypothetical protein